MGWFWEKTSPPPPPPANKRINQRRRQPERFILAGAGLHLAPPKRFAKARKRGEKNKQKNINDLIFIIAKKNRKHINAYGSYILHS